MLIGETVTGYKIRTIQSSFCLHRVTKFQKNDDKVCRFSGRNSKGGIPEYYRRR